MLSENDGFYPKNRKVEIGSSSRVAINCNKLGLNKCIYIYTYNYYIIIYIYIQYDYIHKSSDCVRNGWFLGAIPGHADVLMKNLYWWYYFGICASHVASFSKEKDEETWDVFRAIPALQTISFSLVVHLWNKSHAHLRVNWHEHRRLENLGSADPVPCKLLLVPWRGECTHLRKVLSSPASEGILIGMPLAVPYLVPISMLPDVVEARAAGWTYFQASQRPGQKW